MATEAQTEALRRANEAKAQKAAERKVNEVQPGQVIRVLLPKARDPVQRTVTALVSEVDGDGAVLAWVIPGRMNSDFTIQVIHKSLVTDTKKGYWEAL